MKTNREIETKEELISQAKTVIEYTLTFAIPDYEYFEDWNSVHKFAKDTIDYLSSPETIIGKEELMTQAEEIQHTALNFANPYFDDIQGEWSSVYTLAENVEAYLAD